MVQPNQYLQYSITYLKSAWLQKQNKTKNKNKNKNKNKTKKNKKKDYRENIYG